MINSRQIKKTVLLINNTIIIVIIINMRMHYYTIQLSQTKDYISALGPSLNPPPAKKAVSAPEIQMSKQKFCVKI